LPLRRALITQALGGLRHHPPQRPQTQTQQRCLLIALAQLAHGYAGLRGVQPVTHCLRYTKVLQEADGAG